ncbi:hypothetical protein [Actinoplanes sp. NPDC049599]|uniref:hypothetical protein n=1 Tax=Actinoplanes sp. NPDC049599 TaxID=3363903 RepID=UPI0037A88987
MDLWDLTRLLLRRWYFAVPMLLASVAVVVLAAQTVSPDYKAMGYMQLIPAPSTGKIADPKAKQRPVNPWLDLGYAALGNAAALTVTDTTSLEKLADQGYSDSVTVILNERTPLFEIEAVGHSKEQATGTVRQVIELLQTDIAAKQKQYGTLPEDTISTLVINDGSSPEQDGGKVKRILIVAAGLGLLMTTAATIALDYWLRRRSLRRAADDDSADDTDKPTDKPTDSGRSGLLAEAEKTRVLRPGRSQPVPPQPARTNGQPAPGNVYSSDRRAAEGGSHAVPRQAKGAREGNGVAEPELGVDATVILPAPNQTRRASEKRR